MTLQEEIDVLYHLLDRWWANREPHEHLDKVNTAALCARLHDRVRYAGDLWEYAVMLREELWGLGDGHIQLAGMFEDTETAYFSGIGFTQTEEGVALAWADDEALRQIGPTLHVGDLLGEVDGWPAEKWLALVRLRPGSTARHRTWNAIFSLTYQERFPGEDLQPTSLQLITAKGRRYSVRVPWKAVQRNQPTPNCVRSRRVRDGIGWIRMSSFYCQDDVGLVSDIEFRNQLTRAAAILRDVDELILDIRGNCGGRDQQAQIAAGLLLREPLEWFRYRQRHGRGERHVSVQSANPAHWWHNILPPLRPRRIWVLIDEGCFSTTEVFAAVLRNLENATFVGMPTAGGAGNPVEFRLPCSGFTLRVPVTEIYMPGDAGILIEGNGITPDIPARQSRDGLYAGEDSVLEQALCAIAGNRVTDRRLFSASILS